MMETGRTLEAWLAYIEQLHPESIELGLDRVRRVYQALELDLSQSTVVTIGGTNGKGSTLAVLEQAAMRQKVPVVSYTSPHILNFNERIKIDGNPVRNELICRAFECVEQARQSASNDGLTSQFVNNQLELTYFEFTTLAAFQVIQWTQPNLVLLEVGLGGRLDAVNLVDPDISVITTIALDHQDWLGDTVEEIAFEKAGILRNKRPFVCGLAASDFPESLQNQIHLLEVDFYGSPELEIKDVRETCWSIQGQGLEAGTQVDCQWRLNSLPHPNIPLNNAKVALQVWYLLSKKLAVLKWSETDIACVLTELQVPGRWQRLAHSVPIFLDVAHNLEAVQFLKEKVVCIKKELGAKRVVSIFGAMSDKDVARIVQLMAPIVDLWVPITLNHGRAMAVSAIESLLDGLGSKRHQAMLSFADEWPAFEKTLDPSRDMVLFWGSFFVLSEVLPCFNIK